ncbi:unnamed protein product [Phytomonas sp. EM1]|nr:unnamed protein product [Phytomonas sp. EM1]|eukprot:CCW59779.1 unnamed protein product [Phytomonas sp. isolate EM1]
MSMNKEINELIRDRKAWKRATSQSLPQGHIPHLSSSHAPWSLLRRSSGDHAQTAKFATSLRFASPRHVNSPFGVFFRERWRNSTAVKTPPKDPLFELFEKNIQRRGYNVVKDTLATKQRKTHHHDTACEERNLRNAVILFARQLMVREAEERRSILRREREQRSVLNDFHFEASLELLLDAEYMRRKAIFQAALRETRALAEEESAEFQYITGLCHRVYKRCALLCTRERAARNLIAHEEEQERVVIEKMLCLFKICSAGRSLESFRKRENQLLQLLPKRLKYCSV